MTNAEMYELLKKDSRQPCPGGCEHSVAEHEAFDTGLAAGERGEHELPDEYHDDAMILSEAWLSGNSVGLMNREA